MLNLGPLSRHDDGQPDYLGRLRESFKAGKPLIKALEPYVGGAPKGRVTITFEEGDSKCLGEPKRMAATILDPVFRALGLDELFAIVKFSSKIGYDLTGIVRLLTYGRLLEPASKSATMEQNGKYFRPLVSSTNDDNVYDALDVIQKHAKQIVQRLAEAGFTSSVHHGETPDLAVWLATLPRPYGLFVANDARARHVLDACLAAGLAVPQDISVLSCDNDELICETTTPPLSSIQFDTIQTGFRIAAELDRLMHGCPSSAPAFTYTISNIVTRYSSEVVHVADPLVERALSYIRFNAAAPLPVDLLAAELHVSRRHLEQRFRLVTGRSIHAEIVRTRLARAQTLLRTSQMGVDEIAAHCAFPSASHLCAVFRRHFGVTPSAFRRGDATCEIAWPHSSGRR